MFPRLPPQAEGEEAVPISAQPKDGPGSDGGRGPEHCNGLRREAEGGTALVCVREAVLHQHAGARCAHDLVTLILHAHFIYEPVNEDRCFCGIVPPPCIIVT